MRWRYRLSGWFWNQGPWLLPVLRRARRFLSVALYRARRLARPLPTRYLFNEPNGRTETLALPLITVPAFTGIPDGQTETSVVHDGEAAFVWTTPEPPTSLPPTFLEAQVLAAVSEGLLWTAGSAASGARLLRLPRRPEEAPPVEGRTLPFVPSNDKADVPAIRPRPLIVRHRLCSIEKALADVPAAGGPPTVLFLLPFLAVGGAERLLFDLLEGLRRRYRCLVVTLDPHRGDLGQTVDECHRHTPYVYTLGDWLAREAHDDALRHLIRRYQVSTLVSWNGTAAFYERVSSWRRRFPELRIVNQLYHFEGGWTAHYHPQLVRSVDVHVAVNRPIARALAEDRGVPEEKITTVHHGVAVPPALSRDARAKRCETARRELGLPQDAFVVGSLIRLHEQKRPLDILRLARRFQGDRVHFLIAGGGTLDAAVDTELRVHPSANVLRLPFQKDVEPLFDALDLCLMTSSYEGLPVFLLEGLARSIPFVATAVGDIPLLKENGGGRIAPVGDLDALQAAIREMTDDTRRADAGRRGRATVVERFSLASFTRAYEEIFFPESS